MKRNFAMLLAVVMCGATLAACGGGGVQGGAAGGTGGDGEQLTGSVSTNGSTSMEKVMGALIEAFAEVQPGITVTYDPTGSGSGVEAASSGSADIGLASRGLKGDEIGLTETVVAKDGIAVVVNTGNSVDDLTVEQVAQIARGEITNWSELGGEDAEIAFVGREAGSGTRSAFEEITGTEDGCVYSQELTSTGAVITAVSTTPGAIGYASLSAVEDSVKAVKIGGVECNEETVLDGSYAIQRPFVFATKSDTALSVAAQAFYDFAVDPANADLYTAAGVMPAN